MWYIPDLEEGMELVNKLDPYDENAVKLTPCKHPPARSVSGYISEYMRFSHQCSLCFISSLFYRLTFLSISSLIVAAAVGNPPKVPEGAQHVLMNTALFWNYPKYLPAIGFGMCHAIN